MIKHLQIGLCLSLLTLFSLTLTASANKGKTDFYQIKIYHCKSDQQINTTEQYLKTAYLPALHRFGINKIGVFKPIDNDTAMDKRVIVFIPLSSLAAFALLEEKLQSDDQLKTADTAYTNAAYDAAAYQRIESVLLKAFKNMPVFNVPVLTSPKEERIFELRSYEGASEKLYLKKVSMFNDGNEINIFRRLDFNAVFYAEVLSGAHMPNLMYMTSFKNMKEHDEHWKAFSSDPEWKKLSSMPEYQHTVSKADHILMHATEYSDL
jgi:hypothetical protein